ncbi:MAG TPA: enolase C-terminal domain-like protein [Steroidobacteraceae bacterium]
MPIAEAPIRALRAAAYRIPTDQPEADGTLQWSATTLVVVTISAAGRQGLGYTYSSASIVPLIDTELAAALAQGDALDIPACQRRLQQAVRNLGRAGLAATAISAIDVALWDLKAKLWELPLATLLGRYRDTVPIYGSGGFTSYDDVTLQRQLASWVERDGCRWVKIKVGSEPTQDPRRVALAREAIGEQGLFVDANGAYHLKQAIELAERFAAAGVTWFEEPVSSDDLSGLRQIRRRAPAAIEIAAGEYGYTLDYFRRMLRSDAIDVQQADASRCGGISAFLQIAALCEAHHKDLSAHCAPALHLAVACAAPRLRHQEWFHDHVRIEQQLFDGAPVPRQGQIAPDLSRPGLGLEFKARDAEVYRV